MLPPSLWWWLRDIQVIVSEVVRSSTDLLPFSRISRYTKMPLHKRDSLLRYICGEKSKFTGHFEKGLLCQLQGSTGPFHPAHDQLQGNPLRRRILFGSVPSQVL